jgi:hypothetical protein
VVAAAEGGAKEAPAGDWLSGITGCMETMLKAACMQWIADQSRWVISPELERVI